MNTELFADLAGIFSRALAQTEARLRQESTGPATPKVGSGRSMEVVLEAFEHTTPETGLSGDEAAAIARRAGMDPRGMAGYYAAKLLQADAATDRRWITETGRERLSKLRRASDDGVRLED